MEFENSNIVTETIIPKDMHSIQLNKSDSTLILLKKSTPKALHVYVANEAKIKEI